MTVVALNIYAYLKMTILLFPNIILLSLHKHIIKQSMNLINLNPIMIRILRKILCRSFIREINSDGTT